MKKMKKLLGVLLSMVLIVGMIPTVAFAQTQLPSLQVEYSDGSWGNNFDIAKETPIYFDFIEGFEDENGEMSKGDVIDVGPKDIKVIDSATGKVASKNPFKFDFSGEYIKMTYLGTAENWAEYQIKYVGKHKVDAERNCIYVTCYNVKNSIGESDFWISKTPNMSKMTCEMLWNLLDISTGETYYFYTHPDGYNDDSLIEYYQGSISNIKVISENGKDISDKFVIGTNENGIAYIKLVDDNACEFCGIILEDKDTTHAAVYATLNPDKIKSLKKVQSTVKTTAGKKRATLKLSTSSSFDIDGYQIYRSTKKSSGFAKVADISKTKYVDKKLKSKKTYYYKVRTYKYVDGTPYYGKWSKVVSTKVK